MAKPFDATLKHLLESYPRDWAALLGIRDQPVESVEADLSTVTAEADKVLRIGFEEPWLAHLELQASYDPDLGRRMLRYNVLLDSRLGLPVSSSVLLLRPEADGPRMTGRVQRSVPNSGVHLDFSYRVLRAWQLPAEEVLSGGLGVLPLAPLTGVEVGEVPDVIRKMSARMGETSTGEAASLWTATYVLMGLRYPADLTHRILHEVRAMKESVTYQAILEEGRQEGQAKAVAKLREVLLVLGTRRFGPPARSTREQIEALADLDRLTSLNERILDVESWEELLS